jgi:hypothetical protein
MIGLGINDFQDLSKAVEGSIFALRMARGEIVRRQTGKERAQELLQHTDQFIASAAQYINVGLQGNDASPIVPYFKESIETFFSHLNQPHRPMSYNHYHLPGSSRFIMEVSQLIHITPYYAAENIFNDKNTGWKATDIFDQKNTIISPLSTDRLMLEVIMQRIRPFSTHSAQIATIALNTSLTPLQRYFRLSKGVMLNSLRLEGKTGVFLDAILTNNTLESVKNHVSRTFQTPKDEISTFQLVDPEIMRLAQTSLI